MTLSSLLIGMAAQGQQPANVSPSNPSFAIAECAPGNGSVAFAVETDVGASRDPTATTSESIQLASDASVAPQISNASLTVALLEFRNEVDDDESSFDDERSRTLLAAGLGLVQRVSPATADETRDASGFASSLHLARSLARLSKRSPAEPAAAARLAAARLYLPIVAARGEFSIAEHRERYWAKGELGTLYIDAARHDEGIALLRSAYTQARSASDSLAEFRFGRGLARGIDGAGDRAAALALLERVVSIGHSMRPGLVAMRRGERDAMSRRTLREVDSALGELLAFLLDDIEAREVANPEDAADDQGRLRRVRDLLESQRSAELEDHFGDACLANRSESVPDEIPGALVLYPIVLPDRVAILSGHAGILRYARAPISSTSLVEHVTSLRELLEKRTTRQYIRPAQALYDALIRPLEERLARTDVDTLVIVPDGALRTIPFAALYDNTTRQFLIDRISVAVVPSLRLTEPGPIARDDIQVLAAGIGKAVGGFEQLDYTQREIDELAARFPSQVLFDESFEIAALEDALRSRPYSIVHVATHGRFEAGEDDSYLLAFDGKLGLERMAELIATTRFRREHPLELLTLSACESAAGDEEAALGLAGIALRSGARSALATLWPVNDEATARLINVFYEELARPGQSRAGALRAAQRKVRESRRFEHPGYWAPFLMISNWL